MYRQGMTIPLTGLSSAPPAAAASASPPSTNNTGNTPLSTPLQQPPPSASKDTQAQRRVRFADDENEAQQMKQKREGSVTSPPPSSSHTRILDDLLAAVEASGTSPPLPAHAPPPPPLKGAATTTPTPSAAAEETPLTATDISPRPLAAPPLSPPPLPEKGQVVSLFLDDDVGSTEWKTQFMHNAQNLLRESQRQIQALLHYQTAYEAEVLVTRELREQLRLATEAAAQSRLAQQLDTTRQLKVIQQLQDEKEHLTLELEGCRNRESQQRADCRQAVTAREAAEAQVHTLQKEAHKHAQQLEQAQQEVRRGQAQLEQMAQEMVHLQSLNLKLEAELFEAQRRIAQARRAAAGVKEDSTNISIATSCRAPQRDVGDTSSRHTDDDDGGGGAAPVAEDSIRSMQAYFVTLKSELAKTEGMAATYKMQLSQAEARQQELLHQQEMQAAELAEAQDRATAAAASHHARQQQLKEELDALRRAWEEERLDYRLQEMEKKQLFFRADACLEETLARCMATTAEMGEAAKLAEQKETKEGSRWWVEGKARGQHKEGGVLLSGDADLDDLAALHRSLEQTLDEGTENIHRSLNSSGPAALPYLSIVLHKVHIVKEAVELLCTYTQQRQEAQQTLQQQQQRQRREEQKEKETTVASEQEIITAQREEIALLQSKQTQMEERIAMLLQKIKASEAVAHNNNNKSSNSNSNSNSNRAESPSPLAALEPYVHKHKELLYNALREYGPKTRKLADAVARREDALHTNHKDKTSSNGSAGEDKNDKLPSSSLLQELQQAQQDFLLLLSIFREQSQGQKSSIAKLKMEKESTNKKLSEVEKKLSDAEEKVKQQAHAKQVAAQLRRKENDWTRAQQEHEQQRHEWQTHIKEGEQQVAEREKRLKLLQKKLEGAQQTVVQLQQDKEAAEKECTLLTQTLLRVREELQLQQMAHSTSHEQIMQKGEEALRKEEKKSLCLHRMVEDCVRFIVLLLCKIETILQQKRYLWNAQVEQFCELQGIKQLLRQLSIREDATHKVYLLDVKPSSSSTEDNNNNNNNSSATNLAQLRADLAAIKNPSAGPRTAFKRSFRACALGVRAIARLSLLVRERKSRQPQQHPQAAINSDGGGNKTFLSALLPSLRHLLQQQHISADEAEGRMEALPRVEIPSAVDLVDAVHRLSTDSSTAVLHHLLHQTRVDTQSTGYHRIAYHERAGFLGRDLRLQRARRHPAAMLSYFSDERNLASDTPLEHLFFAAPSTFAVCQTIVAFLAAQQRLVGGLLAARDEAMEALTQQNKQLGTALESQRREHRLIENEIASIEEKLLQQQQSQDESTAAEPPAEVVAELRRHLVEVLASAQQEKNERRQCEERIAAYKKREVHFLMQQNELENEIRSLRIELNSGLKSTNTTAHIDDGAALLQRHNDSRPLLQDELSQMVAGMRADDNHNNNNNNNNNTGNDSSHHRHSNNTNSVKVNVSGGAASSSYRVPPSTVANISAVSSTSYTAEEPMYHYNRSEDLYTVARASTKEKDPYQLYAPASVRRQQQQQEQEPPAAPSSLFERHVNVNQNAIPPRHGSSLRSAYSHEQDGKSPSTNSQTATLQSLR